MKTHVAISMFKFKFDVLNRNISTKSSTWEPLGINKESIFFPKIRTDLDGQIHTVYMQLKKKIRLLIPLCF